MTKIVISKPELFAAATRFASTDTTRYYLHGVYIEPAEGGGILMTALDGVKLFHAFDPDGACPEPVIVKVDKSPLPPVWAKSGQIWIDLAAQSMVHQRGEVRSATVGAARVDATFPDYRRTVPDLLSGEIAQFAFAQFAEIHQASRTLAGGGKYGEVVTIGHNGVGPARLTFGNRLDCFALSMPIRMCAVVESLADFGMPGPARSPATVE